jgi:hypothetical protein
VERQIDLRISTSMRDISRKGLMLIVRHIVVALYTLAIVGLATSDHIAAQATSDPTRVAIDADAEAAVSRAAGSAIYYGDCKPGSFVDPIATLNDPVIPQGEHRGVATRSEVATSVTRIATSLSVLTAKPTVLTIFDANDPGRILLCGTIDQPLEVDGTMAVMLWPNDGPRIHGVAHLIPGRDGGLAVRVMMTNRFLDTSDAIAASSGESSNDAVTRAALYYGDCKPGSFTEPIASLNAPRISSSAERVKWIGYAATTTTVSLPTLLGEPTVLPVFDQITPDRVQLCGGIGGTIAADGSLTIALDSQNAYDRQGFAELIPNGTGGIDVYIYTSIREPSVPSPATPDGPGA